MTKINSLRYFDSQYLILVLGVYIPGVYQTLHYVVASDGFCLQLVLHTGAVLRELVFF